MKNKLLLLLNRVIQVIWTDRYAYIFWTLPFDFAVNVQNITRNCLPKIPEFPYVPIFTFRLNRASFMNPEWYLQEVKTAGENKMQSFKLLTAQLLKCLLHSNFVKLIYTLRIIVTRQRYTNPLFQFTPTVWTCPKLDNLCAILFHSLLNILSKRDLPRIDLFSQLHRSRTKTLTKQWNHIETIITY